MFSSIFDDVFAPFERLMDDTRLSYREIFPPTNVMLTKDGCQIELALAGYKRDDLKFSIDKDNLIIETADNYEPKLQEDARYITNRIKMSKFKRVYSVPAKDYDLSKVSVKFVDGLLTITVPKAKKAIEEPRVITIE